MFGFALNISNRAVFASGVPVPVATAATGISDTSFVANWDAYTGAKYYLLDVSTSNTFSSFILQDQPVYTNSFTVTGLIPNRTYYYRVRANTDYDTDAQSFFTRVTTAGGTLTISEQIAINALVLDMKYAGVWTSMKAVYPMVGSSAAACAQNLISSSYTGSFSSGWTYSNLGVSGDGISSYFQTNLNPSTELTSSVTATAYLNSAYTTAGSYPVIFNSVLAPNYNYWGGADWNESYMGSTSSLITAAQTRTGFFNRRARTGEQVAWRNTTSIGSNAVNYSPANSSYTLAVNDVYGVHNGRYAFVSFGDYITNTQSTALYNLVQTFQTRLSRQVGTPIVADPDVQSFINRVYTAGGTLSNTEVSSVSDLTTDLKVNNLWTKMQAIYPMVGASAAACAQNLKSSSYTASFTAGWTFASTGVSGNGASTYMDTGFVPSTDFASFNNGASLYSRTNSSSASYDYGVQASGGIGHNVYVNYPSFGARWHLQCVFADRPIYTPSGTESNGLFIGVTGAANDRRVYRNAVLRANNTAVSTTSLATLNQSIPLGCLRDTGSGYQAYSQRQYSLFALHQSLTESEVNAFTLANLTFQTKLSRNV